MAGDVDITLPTGEQATVPQADLAQAIAAGATPSATAGTGAYEAEFGGALGQTASTIFGAGRTATGGVTDTMLIEGAGLLGGERSRSEMLHGLNVAKDTNPLANMGGEAAGLFLGAGQGVMGAGAAAEEAAAMGLGKGLLGHAGSMAVRGGVEGAVLGVQHQLTEDTLGDHATNGEKVWAAAEKDGLLGAAIGGTLGAAGYGASKLFGAFRSGPRPAGLLDEVAGAPGAGRPLLEEASHVESLVNDIRKTGVTAEDAALIADDLKTVAKARTAGGPLSGLVDDAGAMYAAKKAGDNEGLREVLERGYVDHVKRLSSHEGVVDNLAKGLSEKGTALMREEEVLNRINFTERPEQFAKLMRAGEVDAERAADAAMRMTNRVDELVSEFERVRMQGGDAVQMGRMRRILTSTYAKQTGIVDAATGAAKETALRDMYMSTYKLKQEVQKLSGFGKDVHRLTPSEAMFRSVGEDLRVGLEDEAVWGRAGAANREWNETFSQQLPRRQDFGSRYGVSIDQAGGVPKPEVDFDKARAILNDLKGGEVDEIRQGVKSAKSYTEGLRSRADAIEKYAEMTPADVASVERLRSAANAFDETFTAARKEAVVIGKVRDQALQEQARSLGGVLGLATDIMTKPLQTMERLGSLKAATERFEKAIEGGINRFFEGKGSTFMRRTEEVVEKVRPKAEVVAEISELRALQANPAAMQERVGRVFGDLDTFAPKTAAQAQGVALRALTYLAGEAPMGRTEKTLAGYKPVQRYSDQEIHEYETKRRAAYHPESVIVDMKAGKLNREGIKTVEFVSPRLFAQMQGLARQQIERMAMAGTLDAMPYQQKAAIAHLLKVTPDGTWEVDFIEMMQATKAPPPPTTTPQTAQGGGRRPIKIDTDITQTEAQQIEGRTT